MKFAEGRAGLQALGDRVAGLSPQLYLQLFAQNNLIAQVISKGMLYFVQRIPSALARFRWRVDQKTSSNSPFEKSFVALIPAFLQSYSLKNESPALIGADYRHFKRFEFPAETYPTYLKDVYGIETSNDGYDVGKVMREDFSFVDSKDSLGVQIADLLASGVRRSLRGEFTHNGRCIATELGRLTIASYKGRPSIELIAVDQSASALGTEEAEIVKLIWANCRPMIQK